MAEPLTVWRARYLEDAKILTMWQALTAVAAVTAVGMVIAWLWVFAPALSDPRVRGAGKMGGWSTAVVVMTALSCIGVMIFLRLRRFEPFCAFGDCNAHLPLTKPWACGYCSNLNEPRNLWARNTYFGACNGCGKRPPALQCQRCKRVNAALADTPVAEQRANCARVTSAGGEALPVYDEAAERHRASLAGLGRDAELIEAETRKLEAEFAKQMVRRKLRPPSPKRPEPPADAVRRRLREQTSKDEALHEARAERLADLERRYIADPETLAAMRDVLDANVERMRVEIAQGK